MSDGGYLPQNLKELLAAKKASHHCPLCDSEDWAVLTGPDGSVLFSLVAGMDRPKAYGLACMNCGFVRWHVSDLLESVRPKAEEPQP